MRIFYAILFCVSALPKAQAEYRVFNLRITSNDGTQSRELLSTLDPDQYRGYHTVRADEKIFYTNTWRCKGRTSDERDFCPDPKRAIANVEAPIPPSEPLKNP
jgi:hypothetical protein